MSKISAASAQRNSTQLSSKSAWSKGPPNTSAASTPRSQSPAPTPTPPANASHSRRPSGLGQAIPIRDGVNVPRSSSGALNKGSSMTFGTTDNFSAPISSSPAATPAIKSEGVRTFGSVPASAGHVNGKSSISASSPSKPSPPMTSTASHVPPTPPPGTPSKIGKLDILKMFQNPSTPSPTASSTSHPPQITSSPPVRPSQLPQTSQTPSSSHHQPQGQGQGQQQPPQPQHFPPFVVRPPPNSGPGGGGSGPRSPVHSRQMTNGAGVGRPPGGPNGPGGPPQGPMSSGLPSPRLAHPHPGQQTGMPPGPPQPMSWTPYYYPSNEPYMTYQPGWYMSPPPPQLPPQHPAQHQQPAHHPPGPGPGPGPGPAPHPNIAMSPRVGPPPLPTNNAPALPPPHQPPSHGSTNSISGLSSPPPTPSGKQLNTNANTFVPNRNKIMIKTPEGQEVKLETLTKSQTPPTVTSNLASVTPSSPKHVSATFGGAKSRASVRLESEEDKKKRLEEEKERDREREKLEKFKKDSLEKNKREAEEKARKEREREREKEEREKKAKAEEEAKVKERLRKEEEEKERIRKADAEKERKRKEDEAERVRLAEEEEKKKKKEAEEERTKAEEAERLQREEAEKELIRRDAEDKAKAVAERIPESQPEAGEVEELRDEDDSEIDEIKDAEAEKPADVNDEPLKDRAKENLRITTSMPPPPDVPKKARPGHLNLALTKNPVTPPLPSALATARIIDDLGRVPYPEGIKSPKVELNVNAKDGKFRYDRDFLMQFMTICKEKPDMLPPLDAIGIEPSDQAFTMSRGGSGRHRQTSAPGPPTPRQGSVGLGFTTNTSFNKPASISGLPAMGNFVKMSSDERFAMATGRPPPGSIPPNMQQFNRPSPMARSTSHGGAGSSIGGGNPNRTRSRRGEKRNDPNKAGHGDGQHGSSFGPSGPSIGPGGVPLDPIVPLELSANRWMPNSISRKPQVLDPDSPELVDRKVKGLLNKLTMEKFDSISDQIIAWANKSEKEKDGRTLIQVIKLVFEKATDEAAWSEMYARLCRKMMEQISPKVQDDGITNSEGKPIAGGQLFRKYLLNRCQEDFERGWVAKEATAAAAATKAMDDQAAKAANDRNKEGGGDEEVALYSDEYYAAQKAKRQGLGLIKFIGELFKLQMLTERIMHECVKKLLGNVENPEEEEIESLCKLLSTVGAILDTNKARAHLDVYFSRMKELTKSQNVSSRMQFMLQDVIELRDRKWITRNLVAAPSTIAQIHEAAAKEKAAHDKESYNRQVSMSRTGSRRGGERGADFPQPGPDGWAVAGGTGPRPAPPKAGDLSNFGKITKPAQMTFGPTSVFTSKKDPKRESLSRTSSSSNMFSMLSQNPEIAVEASAAKSSRPPSRHTSVDLTQSGVPEPPAQRKKLNLLPRSKPTLEEEAPPAVSSDTGSEDEPAGESISDAEVQKRMEEDSKEFFGVRNLDEAEVYFTNLTIEHRFRLVEKLVTSALESRDADAQLVADFFSLAATKDICSPASFEEGFLLVAEILDDVAIDAPKAFNLMAMMLKGAGMDKDEERRTRIAGKSQTPDKLLDLLA